MRLCCDLYRSSLKLKEEPAKGRPAVKEEPAKIMQTNHDSESDSRFLPCTNAIIIKKGLEGYSATPTDINVSIECTPALGLREL
ncbi:hypothetical protein TNCV_1214771 [Trichonephila clavipes]|nr:hypothetical protein TNCV_1214771 [Trichonephila clavipes]